MGQQHLHHCVDRKNSDSRQCDRYNGADPNTKCKWKMEIPGYSATKDLEKGMEPLLQNLGGDGDMRPSKNCVEHG